MIRGPGCIPVLFGQVKHVYISYDPPTNIWIRRNHFFGEPFSFARCNLPLFILTSASQILSGSKQKRYIVDISLS